MAHEVHPWWREVYPEKEWKVFEDFRYFLWLVWRHLELPDPTPVQYDICRYLDCNTRREIIEAFRGVGKSWITSAFVCWLLLRDPQTKIMVVSASKERADQFSTFTLRLIYEMELLNHLYPTPEQRQSKIAFDVAPARADHAPSVKSVGIMGQLTGGRADVIIADDVEVPNNSDTQGMRDKLSERVKEFDAVLKPGGRIIYLGTPQCEDSLYPKLGERGYVTRIWPARYPSAKQRKDVYGESLAPMIARILDEQSELEGTPTDPSRFDELDLQEREASYGRSGFALQFMLDTRLSDMDRYPLKLSDLIVMGTNVERAPEKLVHSADPSTVDTSLPCVGLRGDRYHRPAAVLGDWVEYNGSMMFIDPAGRGKDETSYAVVKMLNGYLYLTAWGGLQGGYDDTVLTTLAHVAKDQKVNFIQVEPNFGDGMFNRLLAPYLQRIYPCTLEEAKRASIQKEKRICDTLEPVMNQHRLVVERSLIEQDMESTKQYTPDTAIRYQGFYQMSRITRERGALAHDDRLDALAGAVRYWVEAMGQDEDSRIEARKEELMDLERKAMEEQAGISLDLLALGASPEQAYRGSSAGGSIFEIDD